MKYIILLLFTALSSNSVAQKKQIIAAIDTQVYTFVEHMPEPGFNLLDFMMKNIKVSDSMIYKEGAPGRMGLRFIVYEDGHTGNYEVTRSSGITIFDKAVLSALSKMPRWKPGLHKGKAVKVCYKQPLTLCFTD